MTRKYSLVIERVSMGYSAYVPEFPTILMPGRSVEEPDRSRRRGNSPLLGERAHRPVSNLNASRIEVELPAVTAL